MEHRKQLILDALSAFASSRPGMEPGNYGDWRAYRSEQRSVTRDLHQARTLLAAVRWRDSITADDILAAAKSAYSGRLEIKERNGGFAIDYCTGQYYPTEFRRAVCAVLAQALWYYTRDHAMPSAIVENGEKFYPHAGGKRNTQSGGDWLRTHFKREFGNTIARRWFD